MMFFAFSFCIFLFVYLFLNAVTETDILTPEIDRRPDLDQDPIAPAATRSLVEGASAVNIMAFSWCSLSTVCSGVAGEGGLIMAPFWGRHGIL